MDIVSHGFAGLLAARAVARNPGRAGLAAAVIGALAPDVDAVARVWDPLASISTHRIATHSLMGGLMLALAVAGVARAFGGSFRRLAGLAYLGVLTHVVLDSFTPFGTAVFWPLDWGRWSVGSLHAADPIVTLILIAGLLPWRTRQATGVARAGALALLGYVLLGVVVMKAVETRWVRVVEAEASPPTRVVVVLAFPLLVRWLGAAEIPGGIVQARFWVWDITRAGGRLFGMPGVADGAPSVDGHPAVVAFLKAAKLPWLRVVHEGDAWVIEYRDLGTRTTCSGGRWSCGSGLDASGAVRSAELDHRF